MPRVYQVARFIDAYPGLFWAPHWATPDRVIPYPLFCILLGQIANVSAAAQLNRFYPALLANAHVWGGKESRQPLAVARKALEVLAYQSGGSKE